MEKLKKQQGALRRQFDNAYTKVTDALENGGKEELEAEMEMLSDVAAKLFLMDEKVQEKIHVEDELNADMDQCAEYQRRFIMMKNKAKKDRSYCTNISNPRIVSNLISHRFDKLKPFKLDLSPKVWPAFWAQFKSVHEATDIGNEEKFQLMLQCLEPNTKGFQIASSYPPIEANYMPLFLHLKRRFGRDELVIDASINEILDVIIKKRKLPLGELVDFLNAQVRTLKTLGVGSDKYELLLYPLLEKCVPAETLALWLQKRVDNDSGSDDDSCSQSHNKIEGFLSFLEKHVENLEHIETLSVVSPSRRPTIAAFHNSSNTVVGCIFCNGDHRSSVCRQAAKMTIAERRSLVKEKRACFTCLKIGHPSKLCKEIVVCKHCKGKHFPIVCYGNNVNTESRKETVTQENNCTSCLSVGTGIVYLKTFLARMVNGNISKIVRLFIDDGSQRSYIRSSLVKELGLKPMDTIMMSQGLFGGLETTPTERKIFNVELSPLKINSKEKLSLVMVEQEKLCGALPAISHEVFLQLRKLGITVNDKPGAEIDVLIGSDVLPTLLTGKLEILSKKLIACETKLGWTVQGGGKGQVSVYSSLCCSSQECTPTFCDLESLGIAQPMPAETEEEQLKLFQEEVMIDDEGRFLVGLQWVPGHPPLPTNRLLAKNRLKGTIKKLNILDLYDKYDNVFKSWESEGIIEQVDPDEENLGLIHYLPHHAVLKDSRTTPVRPVFDASAKVALNSVSLNECLNKGPNLAPKILASLLLFRKHEVGVTADIKQAFLAISVRKEDRDALRFLWQNKAGEMITFRHRRVVFGVASSPFILNAALKVLFAESNEAELQGTVEILKGSFYVDNCLVSFKTEEEALKFKGESMKILARRKFDLREWNSNAVCLRNPEVPVENVLGLQWQLNGDMLNVSLPKVDLNGPVTKRKLLAVCNSIFDPLGIISAFTLIPKLLLQKTWKENYGWDEKLPDNMAIPFLKWIDEKDRVVECAILRGIMPSTEEGSLHVFCDASATAYAACIFVKLSHEIRFVMSKTRISPVRNLTIPRLELMGACIAVRLFKFLKESWGGELKACFWTDSTVVLSWLKNDSPWKTFVSNRVKEILETTEAGWWRHVPGTLNPADDLSRGCSLSRIIDRKWHEGPNWLLRPEEEWPQQKLDFDNSALVEKKVCTVTLVNIVAETEFLVRFKRFSSYLRLIRCCAWIFRYFNNVRSKSIQGVNVNESSPLTVDEITLAENRILRLVQNTVEYSKITDVNTIVNNNGLVVVYSRNVSFSPALIILPGEHFIVERLIEQAHRDIGHGGIGTTLTKLRERFWIINGRRCVKRVLKGCMQCKKFLSKPGAADKAPLPDERVDIRCSPFQNSAVDLFGPLFLRDGTKCWGIIFTCLVFRAVHLDIVMNLSTSSFILALRRFISRRGQVSYIRSDCGSNFVGFKNLVDNIDWKEIVDFSSSKRIKLVTNPPLAPWYNGVAERLIRLTKELLYRNVGRAALTSEELYTVLCDCELTINSRPLSYVSDEAGDLAPITPLKFLNESTGEPVINTIDTIDTINLRKRAQYLIKVRSQLKSRFQKDYLNLLVHRGKNKGTRPICVGDVVLVHSADCKKTFWPLGKVIDMYKGKDGVSRVAKVKTSNGILIRPIQRLYLLEGVNSVDNVPDDKPLPKCKSSRAGRVLKVPVRLDL